MKKQMKIRGHIIDSLTLSKLLDEITTECASCYATEVVVGKRREDVSEANFVIEAESIEQIYKAVEIAKKHGATEL